METDSDPRKEFLLQMLYGHYGKDKNLQRNFLASQELNSFLDDGNCMVFFVWMTETSYHFSTKVII